MIAKLTTTIESAKRFGGLSVVKSGSTYYLYATREGGTGEFFIQRFDVTNPSSPTIDTTFGTNGTFNLATLPGFGTAGFPRGLEATSDGTIFVTATDTTILGDGGIYKIASNLSSATFAAVPDAMDVAIYSNTLYISQYRSTTSSIRVLAASSLAFVADITIPTFPHANASVDSGYAGIDVSADGRIFVVDQLYDSSMAPRSDRVLVSSGAIPIAAGPTAATVSLGGRITNSKAVALANARVSLIGADGEVHTVRSNTFGYYRFTHVTVGETFVVSVAAKGYVFNTRVVSLGEEEFELNFRARSAESRF